MTVTTGTRERLVEEIRDRGRLRAGVSTGIRGLSWRDESGTYRGLDVDTARAVAVAILGDPDAVDFTELDPEQRIPTLAGGEIDVLCCNASWTLLREATAPVTFVVTTAHDGGAFLVPRPAGVGHPDQLAGQRLGCLAGTSSAACLDRYYAARGLSVTPVGFPSPAAALAAYAAGDVASYVCDAIVLAGERTRLDEPDQHEILPQFISHEPMGPAVRDGDPHFHKLVRWVLFALIAAEEEALTPATLESSVLAGRQAVAAAALGLRPDWIELLLRHVGHYGDLYDRSLGAASGLNIPRGRNDLASRGGLLYAPPFG